MSPAAMKYHAASLTDNVDADDIIEEGNGGGHSQHPTDNYVRQDCTCLPASVQEGLRRNPRIMRSLVAVAIVMSVFVAGFRSGEHYEMNIIQSSQTQQQQQQQIGVAIPSVQEPNSSYSKFLVFAEQRTGSRFLTDLLDDHLSIRCGNEELNHPGSVVTVKGLALDDYMDVLDDTWDRLSYTAGNHNHKADGGTPRGPAEAVGFKVMYNQGPTYYGVRLLRRLDESGVRLIHLVRRNKLKQYISTEANAIDNKHPAMKGGHNAHPHTEEEAEKLRQITVNGKPTHVLHFMRQKAEEDAELSDLIESSVARDRFEIVQYEDLSRNTQVVTSRLFGLLGVEDEAVQTDMTKIHKDVPTRFYFEEEQREPLREALEQSEFAWVLDDW